MYKRQIQVGGVDISTVDPEALLRDYSMVFQDVVLFDDTVMENIRLGRRGATDEEVRAAAEAANCGEFIRRLPQGYDTPIGENGAKLSGGERQRISIARALLKDAPIVLLDEATASLDVENETKVQGALSRLLAGKTVLVIAHRMRTVAGADHIVVLDNGRVAEQGTPAELMARGGLYRRMVELQSQSALCTINNANPHKKTHPPPRGTLVWGPGLSAYRAVFSFKRCKTEVTSCATGLTGHAARPAQYSFAPAGILSSTISRFSPSRPFSSCTAEISIPSESMPIIFLGGRFTMAMAVFPTSSSGS